MAQKFDSVEAYLASLRPDVAAAVDEVRAAIHSAVPGLDEAPSYQIIGFSRDGRRIVLLGGWKTHLSTYPVPEAEGRLAERIERYRAGKGTLRYPMSEPMPTGLIGEVVKLLAAQRAG